MSAETLQIEKKTLVPQLRFMGFDGGWKQVKLRNVCDKIQDGNYGGEYPKADEFVEKGIPFLTSKALGGDGFLKEDKIDFISTEKHNKLKKAQLKLNDVLFTNRGSNVGSIGFTDLRIAHGNIGPQLTLLRSNLKTISPFFLYQIMKSETTVKQIRSQDSGSAMNFFGIDTTSKFKLSIPTLPEQEKIASFLSAVDERIRQLSQKKELLEQYKKGVMQQLFSARLRFKDENGKDYAGWEEKKLGDIAKITTGGTPNTFKKEYWGGNIRWMNSGELNLKTVKEVENRITEEGLKNSSTKMIPIKCILIGLAGQGKTRGTAAMNLVELCTNQSIASILPNYEKFIPEYLYQNIDQRYEELRGLSTGDGGRGGLNLQIIKSFKMNLPSISEQQKIADFLSSIDSKIESTNQQINQTQNFKKGLLQQMFV